jgi:hypothetical protein
MENAVILVTKAPVPVVVTDNHFIHWGVMVGPLEQVIMAGQLDVAKAGLQHASAHYAAGVSTKTWPPDKINESKSMLAKFEQAIQAKEQELAQAQQMQAQLQQLQQIRAAGGGAGPMPPPMGGMVPPGAGAAGGVGPGVTVQ